MLCSCRLECAVAILVNDFIVDICFLEVVVESFVLYLKRIMVRISLRP